MNPLFLILLAGGAYYYFSKKNAINQLKWELQGVKIQNGKPYLNILYTNPTNTSLSYETVSLDVFSNGTNIGTIQDLKGQTIKPNGQTLVSYVISPSVTGLASQLFSLFKTLNGGGTIPQITFQIKGTINSMGLPFPIESTTKLTSGVKGMGTIYTTPEQLKNVGKYYMEAKVTYGSKMEVKTNLDLKGQGIIKNGDAANNPRGLHTYYLTQRAYDKLAKDYGKFNIKHIETHYD